MRAVMFHQGALGDFLLALSALECWLPSRAETTVDFWSKREHAALLSEKPYLGGFHPVDGEPASSLLNDSLWETFPLPDFLLRADRVLIFGQKGTRLLSERLSARIGAKVDWVRSFPAPDYSGSHVLDFLHGQPPIRDSGRKPELASICPPPAEIGFAKRMLAEWGIGVPPVLIHPGSGGRKKIWPLRQWRNLIHWIREATGLPVILSVGPADEFLLDFCLRPGVGGIQTVSGLSLVRLSALIRLSRLYIGCDSGVSHLAAAVGAPSVVIFGPTDPAVWGPRGNRAQIVRKSWEEREIFAWDRSEPPGEPDCDAAAAVSEVFENAEGSAVFMAPVNPAGGGKAALSMKDPDRSN